MNNQINQSLKFKLERRYLRLRSVGFGAFPQALKDFWYLFDSEPILTSIETQLMCSQNEEAKNLFNILRKISNTPFNMLRGEIQSAVQPYVFVSHGNQDETDNKNLKVFTEKYIDPFYFYIDEQIDNNKLILNLLYRYKYRSEWFQRERLLQLYENETKKGEKLLALDLYQYLFDEGINFTIEPSSIDGVIDLISAQNSDDPLLADAKIFKGNKTYICEGFGQLYSYTGKYNEPFGYLVIYNVTDKDISFLFENSTSNIPMVTYNHKTIFFITIDLFNHSEPPSKRGLIKSVEIKQEDLFQFVEIE